jgi:hypothetical protein
MTLRGLGTFGATESIDASQHPQCNRITLRGQGLSTFGAAPPIFYFACGLLPAVAAPCAWHLQGPEVTGKSHDGMKRV